MIDLKHALIGIQRRRATSPPAVTRRAAITGGAAVMAAATGDGLARPMNAPPATQTPTGVQAGVTPGTTIANRVIVFGTGNASGVFVYNGTPGPGNVPIAAMTNSAVDPFGNDVQPGDASALGTIIAIGATPPGGTPSFVQLVPGNPALVELGTGDPAEATAGQLVTRITSLGAGVRLLASVLRAPRVIGENVNAFASMVLSGPPTDLSAPPVASFTVSDGVTTASLNVDPTGVSITGVPVTSTAGTAAKPSVLSSDIWHVIGSAGEPPFTGNFAAGAPAPAFAYVAGGVAGAGAVVLRGVVSATGVNAADAAMFTLPYAFPRIADFYTPNTLGAAAGARVARIAPSGAVRCEPASAAGNILLLDGMIGWLA